MLVIDVHQHAGPWPLAGRWGGVEENRRLMDRRGIDVAIISSTRAVVQNMVEGNAELGAAIAGDDRLYAYVTVNPTVRASAERELARYTDHPRFVGAKVHTAYSGCSMDDTRLAGMVGIVAEWGRPLLIHTWGTAAVAALARLAGQHPRLSIIMAHAGGDAWRQAILAAAERPNLYLDFAGSTPYRGAILRALAALGPERILFGTDATLFDPLYMRALFDTLPLDPRARERIMGANALELFHLPSSAPLRPPSR